jgi:hypothetical protein
MSNLPEKLLSIHSGEEHLRDTALALIGQDERLLLHLGVIEQAMDLADLLRQFPTADEDLKLIQILGMRAFNAFAASIKLALSGYGQNSVLIMRDILETAFLIDLFHGDRTLIERWRFADAKALREFSPVRVREALDARYGHTTMKRAERYKMFSELAAHASMKSVVMMRPQRHGDAVIGPFIEKTFLDAVVSEMGQLAIQMGELLNLFFPADWECALEARLAFERTKKQWLVEFYSST